MSKGGHTTGTQTTTKTLTPEAQAAVAGILSGNSGGTFGSLAPQARDSLGTMLSGTPDYAGTQAAITAANAPILRDLNQNIIPGLNQKATFLNNSTGGIKALNRVLPDVTERLSTNANALTNQERLRALNAQQAGLGIFGNLLQNQNSNALSAAGLTGSSTTTFDQNNSQNGNSQLAGNLLALSQMFPGASKAVLDQLAKLFGGGMSGADPGTLADITPEGPTAGDIANNVPIGDYTGGYGGDVLSPFGPGSLAGAPNYGVPGGTIDFPGATADNPYPVEPIAAGLGAAAPIAAELATPAATGVIAPAAAVEAGSTTAYTAGTAASAAAAAEAAGGLAPITSLTAAPAYTGAASGLGTAAGATGTGAGAAGLGAVGWTGIGAAVVAAGLIAANNTQGHTNHAGELLPGQEYANRSDGHGMVAQGNLALGAGNDRSTGSGQFFLKNPQTGEWTWTGKDGSTLLGKLFAKDFEGWTQEQADAYTKFLANAPPGTPLPEGADYAQAAYAKQSSQNIPQRIQDYYGQLGGEQGTGMNYEDFLKSAAGLGITITGNVWG